MPGNVGDNNLVLELDEANQPLTGGDDRIKSGAGDDINYGDNLGGNDFVVGWNDMINAGPGDDEITGGGADQFKCRSGNDTVKDFNEAEGDMATGNCEGISNRNGQGNGQGKTKK